MVTIWGPIMVVMTWRCLKLRKVIVGFGNHLFSVGMGNTWCMRVLGMVTSEFYMLMVRYFVLPITLFVHMSLMISKQILLIVKLKAKVNTKMG